jgi:Tol biopolymer transport system component
MTDDITPQDQPTAGSDESITGTESPVGASAETGAGAATPPRRWLPRRSPAGIAPALSLVGLLIVGLATFQVYNSFTPTLSSPTDTPTPTDTPEVPVASGRTPTPAPTETIKVNPEISVPGILVYVKDGSLWVQSGTTARQLTQPVNGSEASQPVFSPDGQWIYYIDTRVTTGRWYDPDAGNAIVRYTYYYPVLCRIRPDGSGKKDVTSSLIKRGKLTTFFWIRQPSISANGSTAAVVSDGPTIPTVQGMGIHYINTTTGKVGSALPLQETVPLGVSDPRFSPDATQLAYTMEGRSGKYGAPSIWIYKGGTARKLASGYRAASWSPDGKYVAATKVSSDALNVVVLDAVTGQQVAQVTTDDYSWGPIWSPAGNQLVYMHMTGPVVDLNMVNITGSGSNLVFKIEPHLTDFSGLDGGSPAAWYVPGFGPSPTPSLSATPNASATAAPAATPTVAPTATATASAS